MSKHVNPANICVHTHYDRRLVQQSTPARGHHRLASHAGGRAHDDLTNPHIFCGVLTPERSSRAKGDPPLLRGISFSGDYRAV